MPPITPACIACRIDGWITANQEAIRVAQALRTVFLVSPETVTVAQPTAAARSASASQAAQG